jgi:hypothetical protein
MNRLLRDEDTIRRRLLDDDAGAGDVPVEVPGVQVPEPGGEADADPEPELRTPEMIAEPPAESTGGLRRLSRPGLHKVMQALYAAGTSKPLDRSFWDEPKDVLATKSDPLLAIKEQLYQARIDKLKQPAAGAKPPVDETPAIQALFALRPDIAEKISPELAKQTGVKNLKDFTGAADRKAGQMLADSDRDASRESVQKRYDTTSLKELGKISSKYGGLVESLRRIDELAPGILHGQVPEQYSLDAGERLLGALRGPTQGWTANLMTPDAVALQGAIDNMSDLLIRARTGAVINDQEFANYKKLLNTAVLAGPKAVAAVMPLFRREIRARMASEQSPYFLSNPEGFNEWLNETRGLSYKDQLFDERTQNGQSANNDAREATADEVKALGSEAAEALKSAVPTEIRIREPKTAPAGGKVLMRNPKTGETARVDRADIEAARLDGFVEVPGGR